MIITSAGRPTNQLTDRAGDREVTLSKTTLSTEEVHFKNKGRRPKSSGSFGWCAPQAGWEGLGSDHY